MREVQRLSVDQVLTRETTNVTVDKPDGGTFTLSFTDPKSGNTFTSSKINTNGTSWDFNLAVRDFYLKYYSADIDVSKVMYNAEGLLTTNLKNHTKAVFSIIVKRSLNVVTTSQITSMRSSTSAKITVILPKNIQVSNPAMSGAFRIKCALDMQGNNWNTSYDVYTTNSTSQVMTAIVRTCPIYREKIEIWDGPKYPYY